MAIKFVDSAATGANDGTSWADAYTSLHTAISAVNHVAGDQFLVSGTFNETVTIAEVAANTTPTYVQGDDKSGGAGVGNPTMFTIDGQATRSSCLSNAVGGAFYVFSNMRCTNATSNCFNGGGIDSCVWIDCRFDNAGALGWSGDNNHIFIRCTFDNNVTGGVDMDNEGVFIDCISHTNGNGYGLQMNTGVLFGCLIYNNGTGDALNFVSGVNTPVIVINCTLDGENTGVIGIDDNTASVGTPVFINNIIHDFTTGMDFLNDYGRLLFSGNNVFSSCTTNVNGNVDVGTGENPQTGTPTFTSEAVDDYTLASGDTVAAKNGTDAGDVVAGGTSFMDIGAHQRVAAGVTRPRQRT